METKAPKFWCHTCRKEFTTVPKENQEVICTDTCAISLGTTCGNTFCEMIEEGELHPSNYEPFSEAPTPPTTVPPRPAPPPAQQAPNPQQMFNTQYYIYQNNV